MKNWILFLALAVASIPGFAQERAFGTSELQAYLPAPPNTFSVKGDGVSDDTAAINAAIKSLPASGGTISLPSARYLIDPRISIQMRSNVRLKLAPDAVLVAMATSEEREAVIRIDSVTDAQVEGGQIVGNRYDGLGTTGEWGHGIFVRGSSRVTIRDMRIVDCWGDGVSIGANARAVPSDDVALVNVRSIGNRRQGLSIGRSRNVLVSGGEYSDTKGTKPASGIDIEPDAPGEARNITIDGVIASGNEGYGIQVYKRTTDGGHSWDVAIRNSIVERNSVGIVTYGGLSGYGVHRVLIEGNAIRFNRNTGLWVQKGTEAYSVVGNRFKSNYTNQTIRARAEATKSGVLSTYSKDILVQAATSGTVGANVYEAQP